MTDTSEWSGRVGHVWAEEWRRTDRSFGALTPRLLERIDPASFTRALDVGCGAGELSLALTRANPSADVVGIDISADLLAIARERGEGAPGVRFIQDDAATTRLGADNRFDLIVSRHGVMFFLDPAAAFAHLRSRATPASRMVFSCFRAREDNAWAAALASVMPPQPPADPAAPGPFAFADPERVEALLAAARWEDIAFEPFDYTMIAGEGSDAVDEALAYFQRIGPAARAMAELPERERPAVREALRAVLATHYTPGRVTLPAAAWIVSARVAGAPRL